MKHIALIGSSGKLGKEIIALSHEQNAILHPIKRDEIALQKPLDETIDAVIDVALHEGIEERIFWAIAQKKPIIIGTTGWDSKREKILKYAQEKKSSLVWSSNFSIGIWLVQKMITEGVKALQNLPEFEIALFEAHHAMKKDSPSGTLLSLQETIQNSITSDSKINYSSMRVGHVPGTHMIWIDGPDESIQITHTARNKKLFAQGIFKALTLLEQYPGVWHFSELLDRMRTIK